MISLIAASFAILVKQWLREYLIVKNPSPQARLRVRRLREPQLAVWRVTEIAAVLPLLLQLSLGLFFVGMCYFTSAIHSSIGYTTVPLVAGWAACFLSVTLLPFVFPRCPYRTPLLKAVVYSWHRRFYGNNNLDDTTFASRASLFIRSTVADSPELNQTLPAPARTRLTQLAAVVREQQVSWASVRNAWSRFSLYYANPRQQISRAWSTLRSLTNVWHRFSRLYADWQEHVRESDEAKAAANGDADVDILTAVDIIQSNDELFGTAIFEAVKQICPHTDQFHQFMYSALRRRVQLPEDAWTDRLPHMDLSKLAAAPRTAMIELIVQHLTSWQLGGSSNRSALIAVLMELHRAPLGQDLPYTGIQFLRTLLYEKGEETCHTLVVAAARRGDLDRNVARILYIMTRLAENVIG